MSKKEVHVHCLFETISGEAGGLIPQGAWCSVIRLRGCNLKCDYCDTKITQGTDGGRLVEIDRVVESMLNRYVLLTGGEPLLQKNAEELIHSLLKAGKWVQVETNGTIEPPVINLNCDYVIDVKGPSSGAGMSTEKQKESMLKWVGKLHKSTIIKFVVKDDNDFNWACSVVNDLVKVNYQGQFAFSPIDGNPKIMEWMITSLRFFYPQCILDRLIFSLQIHKICNLP